MSDILLPFMFDAGDVRGAIVDLDRTWREVLVRRDYPLAVRTLLGQAMAAAALLSSTLKFDGTMVLQAQAESPAAPVRVLVVECNADLSLRATAKLTEGATPGQDYSLRELVGAGRLVITLDPKDGQAAYQGVVPLEGAQLNAALENYMLRSEQVETRLWLAADETRACGLMLQRMPRTGGKPSKAEEEESADRWHTAQTLAGTVASRELLTLPPREVLRRLFHEFDLRLFNERHAVFRCTCSRQRVAGMLNMLGREEVESILAERGMVSVDCEFCNKAYTFDPIDAAQLFMPAAGQESGSQH
ncbi:MAG TPA: Hsp33 family molecular chaperone HslO [Burkholderiales bacterium]|jgi:molecular chaperone Hsp33